MNNQTQVQGIKEFKVLNERIIPYDCLLKDRFLFYGSHQFFSSYIYDIYLYTILSTFFILFCIVYEF